MSYSIGARAETKAEVKAELTAKFDEIVQHQEAHKHDRDQALAVANAYIDLLPDDPGRDVSVSMNGWLSLRGYSNDAVFMGASVSVTASIIDRLA